MVNLYLGSENDAGIRSLAQTKGSLDGYVLEALSKALIQLPQPIT